MEKCLERGGYTCTNEEESQMSLINLSELAAQVPNGAKLVVAKDDSGVPMAATRELVRQDASKHEW